MNHVNSTRKQNKKEDEVRILTEIYIYRKILIYKFRNLKNSNE